jgi:pimeloyl-ACP methyl ester carboxylesterase
MKTLFLVVGVLLTAIAVAFSESTVALVAIVALLAAWAERRSPRGQHTGTLRHVMRFAGLVSMVLLVMLAIAWWYSRPPTPDAFYDAPDVMPSSPGMLVRHEQFTRTVPGTARAWRILYSTTRNGDVPTVASAIVLSSAQLPSGPRPVLAWTHGTTGIAPGCAPSVLAASHPFEATIPALADAIAEGWIVVATDYAGLGTSGPHEYLIGESTARSALDSIRAARQIAELSFDNRVAVWGHSQGGHAALWTGGNAPRYAPELNIVGVAALAPATALAPILEAIKGMPIGRILSAYVLTAYAGAYPDVRFDQYVRLAAHVPARDMASRCLAPPGAILSALQATRLEDHIFAVAPSTGALAKRFEENTPRHLIPAPLLIAQAKGDELIPTSIQDQFVKDRCDAGQRLEYRIYDGRDHISVLAEESALIDDLVQWTKERFAGTPQPAGCQTILR